MLKFSPIYMSVPYFKTMDSFGQLKFNKNCATQPVSGEREKFTGVQTITGRVNKSIITFGSPCKENHQHQI